MCVCGEVIFKVLHNGGGGKLERYNVLLGRRVGQNWVIPERARESLFLLIVLVDPALNGADYLAKCNKIGQKS